MPFSREQFFGVFAAYNHDIWPMQAVLFFVAVAAIAAAVENRRAAVQILAGLWVWCAIAYHWMHFVPVNPAAWLFGALFLTQAVLLVRNRPPLEFIDIPSRRIAAGGVFIAYALVAYPVFGTLIGHAYPYSPTFGAPCPLTIFTLGVLMMVRPPLPLALAIPALLWSLIASPAIFRFGMIEDAVLPLAAAAYVAFALHDRGLRVASMLREVRHA